MNKPADLIAYIFDSKSHRLRNELADWMEASPRFTSFVETYRDKIRKKIRVAQGPDSLLENPPARLPRCAGG